VLPPGKEETLVNVTDALERISTIHSQLAKGEEYRGYRPLALAVSGLVGLLLALLQPSLIEPDDPAAFVRYQVIGALVCAVLAGSATAVNYLRRDDEFARRRTRTVLRQMLPCLFAGAIVTAVLARPEHLRQGVTLLPGLWALFYGLGTVASLPYLPRSAGGVAGWFLTSGGILLCIVEGPVPSGWTVGLPFGIGQLLAALVLYSAGRPEIHE
jgi:hypothetical protein